MLGIDIKLLPFQGVTNERALTQGVASLALGYALVGLSARALPAAPQSKSSKLDCVRFVIIQPVWN